MIIQILLLTIGLDMSRPEFEPTTDISGNYIMGSYDVSSDDYIVEELEEVPEEVIPSVDDSLSTSPVRGEQLSVSGNDDVVSAIQSLQDDNNAYWELFLDSYPVEVNHNLNGTYVSNVTWKFSANGSLNTASGASTDLLLYFPVVSGITYHVTDITTPSFNSYRYGVVNDYSSPTGVVTNFNTGNPTSIDFTAGQDGYFCMYISYNKPISCRVSWVTIEQESYTLSELGNAVMDTKELLSQVRETIRAILLFVLFAFAYPIALAIVKNIVGGDK